MVWKFNGPDQFLIFVDDMCLSRDISACHARVHHRVHVRVYMYIVHVHVPYTMRDLLIRAFPSFSAFRSEGHPLFPQLYLMRV